MKRTTQMKNAGVASPLKPTKFKGFKKKQPKYNAPARYGDSVKGAAAAFAVGGSQSAIAFLGSKAKFVALSPLIKRRVEFWLRAARHHQEITG